MGFLANIGRASPAITQTMTDIEERPRRALRWGWEQEQVGQQKEIFGQQKALNEMNINAEKAKAAERQKREDFLKKPWNADLDLVFSGSSDEFKNKAIKTMRQIGILDEKGMGTMEGREMMVKMLREKPDITKVFMEDQELQFREQAQEALDKLRKTQSKPDTKPEDIQKLMQNAKITQERLANHQKAGKDILDVLNFEIYINNPETKKMIEGLPEQKQKQILTLMNVAKGTNNFKDLTKEVSDILQEEAKQITPSWEIVKDPKSPTGWSRQDMNNPNAPLRTGAPVPKAMAEVNVNIGEKSFTEIGKKMGEKVVEEQKDAQQAYSSLGNLQDAKKLLSSGMITGTGAGYILNVGKALQQAGINLAPEEIANTEAYAALMGKQVGQIIKQFGAGTGLSDADREYAEKIAGGKITLTKQSLEKIIEINEKGLRNVVNNYNKRAKGIMSKPEAKDLPYSLIIETNPELMGLKI